MIDIDVDDDGSVAYRLDQEGQIPLIPDLDLMQSLGRLEARIRSESSRLSSHQPSNAKMLVADSPLLQTLVAEGHPIMNELINPICEPAIFRSRGSIDDVRLKMCSSATRSSI